jgi:hypothetical protein
LPGYAFDAPFVLKQTFLSFKSMLKGLAIMVFKSGIVFLFALLLISSQASAQQVKSSNKSVAHLHPTHGPHQGELLEIGKEEYHAELLIDEGKKQILIYLLDKDAKSSVAIEAPFVMVNFLAVGKPFQLELKSIPQETDPKGYSSCFGAVSPELMTALHTAKSEPKLSVRIRNKAYVTKIVHKHDHSGHNHAQQPAQQPVKKR